MYRVWHSAEGFAKYLIHHTQLKRFAPSMERLHESDASKPRQFHTLPDHIKQILYLDAPDIIVERNGEPIFSVEISAEAGTGHNVFQRFSRLAASVEHGVPTFYIYPEAVVVSRQGSRKRWDRINPLVFRALDAVMSIYDIPALLYFFPSKYRADPELRESGTAKGKGLLYENGPPFPGCPDASSGDMKSLFTAVNEVISRTEKWGIVEGRASLLKSQLIRDRRTWMNEEYVRRGGHEDFSPLSSTLTRPTSELLRTLKPYERGGYRIGELLRSRPESVIYSIDAVFRGDPYPGCLAAIDYLRCREGKTFEDRSRNLVLAWGKVAPDTRGGLAISGSKGRIRDFTSAVRTSVTKDLLGKTFKSLQPHQIPRYYMQCRYGSMFSKVKHVRVYSYFADAILFPDGALWRDG